MKREVDSGGLFSVRGKDEFSELAVRLNQRIGGEEEKFNSMKDDLVRTVSDRENEKYLQNINDGVLFIDYGQIISGYYSRTLAELFDREEIKEQHLSDFLYPDREKHHQSRKELEKFIIGLFNDPAGIDDLTDETNPLHDIWISRDDGRRILVDGTFRKVEERGDLVELMILFRDKTDVGVLEKKLDESDMRSDFELDTVVSILRAGPGPLLQFIEESREVLADLRPRIPELENPLVINSFFREVHIMKCSALYFDFRAVEKLCHNLEDILSAFRKGDFSRKEAVDIIIDDIHIQFDHMKHLVDRFREFLATKEGRVYETDRNELEHFFDTLQIMMSRHADELGKEVIFSFRSDFENFEAITPLQNSLILLLRNALDHGIEFPDEREAAGKERSGHVSLVITGNADGSVKISVEDDGTGIDFEHLREIAVEKGFIKKEESPGEANLIRTLFTSGFSTREEMSELSGRGVGLDAVKNQISRMGGKISVKTERLKGSRFTIILPPG